MALINIKDLSFTYNGSYDPVFQHLNLQLDTDWRLGFIGRNGRGKTTLLRLLAGMETYRGQISASVVFDSFPFEVPYPELTVGAVADGLRPEAESWRLVKEMRLLDLEEEMLFRPFSTLSNGEQTRFLLALLFLQDDHFLLIDEPTNHLDVQGRALVGAYLAKKRGFILVSHDRQFLDQAVDHVLAFNRTGLEVQKGNFSTWWKNKEYRDQFELGEQEKLKKDIKRLDLAAKRTTGWSSAVESTKYATLNSGLRPDRGYIGHKAAKLMKRAKAVEGRRQTAVEEKSKLLKDLESAVDLALWPLQHPQDRLVEAVDLVLSYDGKAVCGPVSFEVRQGDRVALRGSNGAGKSSILKLVLGQDIEHTGTLHLASGLVLSYLPQDTSFLRGSLTQFARESGIDETLFKTILRKLDFERVQFEKDMVNYSGGQKKKVVLARSLCQEAHLYLWDEPLNFVDVYSRMQIEQLVLQCVPTMLFVEHDQAFVERVATEEVLL